MIDVVTLWMFPAEDFADWLRLVGESPLASYDDYLELVDAVEDDLRRQGLRPVRVWLAVDEMRRRLNQAGWPNDPDHRAAVIAEAWANQDRR